MTQQIVGELNAYFCGSITEQKSSTDMSVRRKKKGQQIEILYEDNHLIAVSKPAGVLVHSDDTGDDNLIDAMKDYIKHQYNKPGEVYLGLVQRLDRPVSGVVLMAKTSKALSRMNKLFQDRKVDKTYRAIINRVPDPLEGKLEQWLKKDGKNNVSRAYDREVKESKQCELSYRYIAGMSGYHMLEVYPKTGRPHQIRVQLAHNGTPIVGDLRYGYPRPTEDKSICLHCLSLSFVHPVKQVPITITDPIPQKAYWSFFKDID